MSLLPVKQKKKKKTLKDCTKFGQLLNNSKIKLYFI